MRRMGLMGVSLALFLAFTAWAEPPMSMRGTVEGFPFSLGTTMYGGMWDGGKANETRTDWWWLDRAWWNRKFAEMERLHLNTLVFTHPHPYVGLVDVPGYPEARYFDEATFARYHDTFDWVVHEGRKHDIKIYFLTWNICLPPGFVKAHNVPEFGEDTALTRAYTRAAVAALFKAYPDLGGLITEAAESPPGCVDFVEDAICGGLKDSGVNPELIFWSWCSYPADSQRIRAAYSNTRLLHYLQYEQFFSMKADPRIGRFSHACGDAPMVALGGPKSALSYLFWGDPDWARQLVEDMRRQNVTGFLIETYCEDPWLALESLARYSYDLDKEYFDNDWIRVINAHYGHPDSQGSLYQAMIHASEIAPLFLKLVHSQTDHYMPQFGLPLAYYLEMPTLSSYVFENVQTLDQDGFLRPNMGLCWPNPDWGENVTSVWDFARGGGCQPALVDARTDSPRHETPLDIARSIEQHAVACSASVTAVREKCPAPSEQLDKLLHRLELNAQLGMHYAAKIRAAIAWACFKSGAIEPVRTVCKEKLQKSVEAWENVVKEANILFPEPVPMWRSELNIPPPWTQDQIWGAYASAKMHWRDNLEPFKREVEIISAELDREPSEAALPLWENLRGLSREKLQVIFEDDFESPKSNAWVMGDGTSFTDKQGEIIDGKGSLRMDTRAVDGEWHMALKLRPEKARMEPGKQYQVSFRYRILSEVKEYPDTMFAIAARTDKGGIEKDIGDRRWWSGHDGAIGYRTATFAPEQFDDYAVFFSIHGHGAIVIDDFMVGATGRDVGPIS